MALHLSNTLLFIAKIVEIAMERKDHHDVVLCISSLTQHITEKIFSDLTFRMSQHTSSKVTIRFF